MRLPTQPRARSVPPARRALVLALLALWPCATPALASRWTVDLAGGGDFTTIQAALDQQAIEFRDTVLVMPGEYAETITPPVFGWQDEKTALVSADGAAVTWLQSLVTAPYTEQRGYAHIDGFTFTQAVSLIGHDPNDYPIVHCIFLGEVIMAGGGYPRLNISDCDFHARTRFPSLHGTLSRLRFHSAPLAAGSIGGVSPFTFEGCIFEGPADTLVHVLPGSDEADSFVRCAFRNAGTGIVFEGGPGFDKVVSSCMFADLSTAGVWMQDSTEWAGPLRGLEVRDSRFERCGTAVHCVYRRPWVVGGAVSLHRDTILASSGNAVVLGPSAAPYGSIADCSVSGSGGWGALFMQNYQGVGDGFEGWAGTFSTYSISNVQFTNNAAGGLFVQDTAARTMEPSNYPPPSSWRTRIRGCTFEGNGGDGLRLEAPVWTVDSCVAIGNSRHGFSLRGTSSEFANRSTRNTSVLNQGDGLQIEPLDGPPDSLYFIERNLTAMNVGAGIRVPLNGGLRRFAYNDAWNNYLAPYVAPGTPADSNLTVDPRFCGLGAGDLGLEQGSPCGPSGPYGPIGARPESCPNTLAVELETIAGVEFAVRPSVARGSVEFVPPAAGGEGEVALFDLAGRVVWRAPLGPATGAVRWQGQGESGRVRAGLYWARFTRGSERATRRLVWLG